MPHMPSTPPCPPDHLNHVQCNYHVIVRCTPYPPHALMSLYIDLIQHFAVKYASPLHCKQLCKWMKHTFQFKPMAISQFENIKFLVDCQVSDWRDTSDCSAACSGGTKTRTRDVVQQPQFGGEGCPALEETIDCNIGGCKGGPLPCKLSAPIGIGCVLLFYLCICVSICGRSNNFEHNLRCFCT